MTTAALLIERESDFATWLEDALRLHGWLFTHFQTSWHRGRFRTAISGDPGFPDYVCVKGKLCLFIETKTEKGRLSPSQIVWSGALRAAGQTYVVLRPSDRELIMKVLAGKGVLG